MPLTPQQLEARRGRLTASAVGILMGGDDAKVYDLWRNLIGDPSWQQEDISHIWPVILGSTTEEINLNRYEYRMGRPVTRRGEVVIHPTFEWAAATLDGFDEFIPACVEAKHVGGREPLAKIIARYTPQCHWQMLVTQTSQCQLSVIEGANEPVIETIMLDEYYASELWQRATAFMACVHSLTPPCHFEPIVAPDRPTRIANMGESNEWGSHAQDWLDNKEAKKKAETAEKELKRLVPSDVEKAHGHGVVITRDRAGRLSLREEPNAQRTH